MIIDMKIGDVNGDRIPDTVYLIGDNNQYPLYENLMLVIEDGRSKYRYTIPLPSDYNSAMEPWIFLGDFTGDKVDDILINMPLNNREVYYIATFKFNQPAFLLAPDEYPVDYTSLSQMLGFEVIYKDYYKVDIASTNLNQTITLDISNRKQEYEGVIYNENDTLIKPFKGFVLYSPHLYPIQFNRNEAFRLMAMDDIAGMSHADALGYLVYYLKYSDIQHTWVLDPEQAEVLIQ